MGGKSERVCGRDGDRQSNGKRSEREFEGRDEYKQMMDRGRLFSMKFN